MAILSATRASARVRTTGPKASRRVVVARVASPIKEEWVANLHAVTDEDNKTTTTPLPARISREAVCALEAELDQGAGVQALRRFNAALKAVPSSKWRAALDPLFSELCFNLESFNPAFAACVLQVQRTIGVSDYVRRDVALKNLIQPLAGEYGMHNGLPQLKTHRELFSDFYQSLFGTPLANLLATSAPPTHAPRLYHRMMRDILSGGGAVRDDFSRDNNGGRVGDSMQAACYALGYNLAIEYLADYEKTWMLDTFRGMLDAEQKGCLAQAGLKKEDVDWVFLEVHAEGEAEHAAIGHSAVLALVGEEDVGTLRAAMADHDRDFAEFYDAMADLLIEKSKE